MGPQNLRRPNRRTGTDDTMHIFCPKGSRAMETEWLKTASVFEPGGRMILADAVS
jgi:hypothetical protein